MLAAACCSSDRSRSTDGPAGSTTVVALSSPPRTIFCRPSLNTALATAVRLTLNAGSRVTISFYVEHLDANRFFGSDYEESIARFSSLN